MSYIRQLPSGRWQAIVRQPDGRRGSKINEAREAVERWAESYDQPTAGPAVPGRRGGGG